MQFVSRSRATEQPTNSKNVGFRGRIALASHSGCLVATMWVPMLEYPYCHQMITVAYLSGTFITCQLCGFWHFSVVSATFASACKHVVTWGGVCVYFLKSARKRHFRNVWVWGGGVVIFQRSTTHGAVHTNTALHRLSIFIQNHCHCQHCFFQAFLEFHLYGRTPCCVAGSFFAGAFHRTQGVAHGRSRFGLGHRLNHKP